MNARKKLWMAALAILCTLTVAVGATVAYLSSVSKPVENVFTIGQIKLALTETTGDVYQMVPGKAVSKNPKVTVEGGNEDCWLFVKVQKTQGFDDYFVYEMAEGWTVLGGFEGIYYREVVASPISSEFPILQNDTVTVKDDLTEEKMSAVVGLPTINFTAYAVQSYSIDTARDAWGLILQENEG